MKQDTRYMYGRLIESYEGISEYLKFYIQTSFPETIRVIDWTYKDYIVINKI